MPRVTKQDLNKIEYISMGDYIKNLNKIASIEDKMKYTTRYLLNHKGEEDYSLVQSIYIARQQIGNALAKSNNKENLDANMFVANPIEYVRQEAQKLAGELSKNDEYEIPKEKDLLGRCNNIGFYQQKDAMVQELSNLCNDRAFTTKAQLAIKTGGRKALNDIKKDTKPGFFSRLFNTTSRQWKALDAAYNDFSNLGSQNYGDKTNIKNAAVAYLQHKFPGYEESQALSSDVVNRLDKTSKARTLFALNLLKSVKDQEEIDRNYTASLAHATEKNVSYDDIVEARKNNVIDLDQVEFQNDLGKKTENNIYGAQANQRLKVLKEYGSIENVAKAVNELEQNILENNEISNE